MLYAQTEQKVGEVTVMAFERSLQSPEACLKIEEFRSIEDRMDYRGRFAQCSAKDIPFGRYKLRFVSALFQPHRDFDCLVSSKRSVYMVPMDHGDLYWGPILRVDIKGLKMTNDAVLIFRSVFPVASPWVESVRLDESMSVSIMTDWMDLTATLLVAGKAIGTASIDRRQSLHSVSLVVDVEHRFVSVNSGYRP